MDNHIIGDKNLKLADGRTLHWFTKKSDHYINKTIVIYGKRDSGKSVIVDEIMYLCKDYIPNICVIAKSKNSNNPYKNKIPSNCIKANVSKDWLEEFFYKQENRANIYRTANEFDNLKSVFDKIKTSRVELIENKIINEAINFIEKINFNPNYNFSKKKEDIDKIETIRDKKLIDLFKTHIRFCKNELEKLIKQRKLTEDEICVVNYLDFKPHTMLVFDDCASKFKEWCKKSTIIKEMFYEGRHSFITLVITTQSDKELVTELRQNTDIAIYTTDQSAICSFNRSSDAHPKYIKELAQLCVKRVFSKETRNGINYKKLIYINKDGTFYYTIANRYKNFQMGCKALWELDQKLNDKKKSNQKKTDFFNKYYNI